MMLFRVQKNLFLCAVLCILTRFCVVNTLNGEEEVRVFYERPLVAVYNNLLIEQRKKQYVHMQLYLAYSIRTLPYIKKMAELFLKLDTAHQKNANKRLINKHKNVTDNAVIGNNKDMNVIGAFLLALQDKIIENELLKKNLTCIFNDTKVISNLKNDIAILQGKNDIKTTLVNINTHYKQYEQQYEQLFYAACLDGLDGATEEQNVTKFCEASFKKAYYFALTEKYVESVFTSNLKKNFSLNATIEDCAKIIFEHSKNNTETNSSFDQELKKISSEIESSYDLQKTFAPLMVKKVSVILTQQKVNELYLLQKTKNWKTLKKCIKTSISTGQLYKTHTENNLTYCTFLNN